MDDGRSHMWTRFIMENEMATIVAPPLLKRSSNSMVVAPPLLQLSILKQCHKKKKTMDDETNVGGRWSDIALANIFDLYEEEWRYLDKSCLSFKHWTHICIEHHCQLPNECQQTKEQINNKIEKMKSEY